MRRVMWAAVFFLLAASYLASAEKVAPENASEDYFISRTDCSVAVSRQCAKLNLVSEYIYNESNSKCTWWCRPVRTSTSTSVTSSSSSSSSSSSTRSSASSTTRATTSSSSPDYTLFLIAGACVLVFLWQIIAYIRSLGGVK